MTYKILVTTVATRIEAVSIDVKIIEIDGLMMASGVVKRINDNGSSIDHGLSSVNIRQTALPLNFTIGD